MQIDLWSVKSFAGGHPHEQYRWLREHDPVHWHDEPGGRGFWVISRYADVRRISRDPDTFSSHWSMNMTDVEGPELEDRRRIMMNMDRPKHTRYRRLVSAGFTPKRTAQLRPRIDALAARIVDEVIDKGECDLITDLAAKMPAYFIAELVGIPPEDGLKLYQLTETMHASPEVAPLHERGAAKREMLDYARTVARSKREHPADDIATDLAHAEIDGERLSEEDFEYFFLLLINAGGDTTRNLVGSGMLTLIGDDRQRELLAADLDGLLEPAVEEMLRFESPVVHQRRTATRDVDLGGRSIRKMDKVILYYGSANRDEDTFVEPDTFDITRHPNDHVAFGSGGPHICLGAHLARLEGRAMVREILTRLPGIRATGEPSWLGSNFITGPSHLPVAWDEERTG